MPRHPTLAALLAALLLLPSVAAARDDRLLLTIEGALSKPDAKDRLDDTVQFFWGDQPYATPLQSFGIHTTRRSTYALNKTDLDACDWAFLSALVALRDKAKEVGANAVVDIKSIYKNREFRSDSQYECRAGHVVTGVSLEGRLVKLPGPGVMAIPPGP